MSWNRKLWGVQFTGSLGEKMLIGSAWHDHRRLGFYDGEPAHALLFCTREQARAWCRQQTSKYEERNDVCAKWRFRAVRVRETVKTV